MENKTKKLESNADLKLHRKIVKITIHSNATIELLNKLKTYVEKSHYSKVSDMYETAFSLGIELMIKNNLEENKSIFDHIEETVHKYKNYMVKDLDARIINLVKYLIVNERKINLIINCLSERDIIDAPYFIESEQAISLTEDVPWIRQLKADLDADFANFGENNNDEIKKSTEKEDK